ALAIVPEEFHVPGVLVASVVPAWSCRPRLAVRFSFRLRLRLRRKTWSHSQFASSPSFLSTCWSPCCGRNGFDRCVSAVAPAARHPFPHRESVHPRRLLPGQGHRRPITCAALAGLVRTPARYRSSELETVRRRVAPFQHSHVRCWIRLPVIAAAGPS